MSAWQIVDEPTLDRLGIINPGLGFDLYIPHWSTTRVETARSPPESGIRAELLCCHTKSTWTYSLTRLGNLQHHPVIVEEQKTRELSPTRQDNA